MAGGNSKLRYIDWWKIKEKILLLKPTCPPDEFVIFDTRL